MTIFGTGLLEITILEDDNWIYSIEFHGAQPWPRSFPTVVPAISYRGTAGIYYRGARFSA